jgi:hypothetical protein
MVWRYISLFVEQCLLASIGAMSAAAPVVRDRFARHDRDGEHHVRAVDGGGDA